MCCRSFNPRNMCKNYAHNLLISCELCTVVMLILDLFMPIRLFEIENSHLFYYWFLSALIFAQLQTSMLILHCEVPSLLCSTSQPVMFSFVQMKADKNRCKVTVLMQCAVLAFQHIYYTAQCIVIAVCLFVCLWVHLTTASAQCLCCL